MVIYKILLKRIISVINKKVEKFKILVNILFLYFFLRDIHEGNSSLRDADDAQSIFAAKIKNLDKGKKQLKKGCF